MESPRLSTCEASKRQSQICLFLSRHRVSLLQIYGDTQFCQSNIIYRSYLYNPVSTVGYPPFFVVDSFIIYICIYRYKSWELFSVFARYVAQS